MRTIRIKKSAAKELEDIASRDQDSIATAIKGLALNPFPAGCKKLAGTTNEFRIRCGHYRIIYTVEGDDIFIFRIRHRKDVYR